MIIDGNIENFEKEVLRSDKTVIVDFNASWCPPCQMLKPILADFAKDMEQECKVVAVDIDESQALAAQYEIATIPCLILFRNGEEVDRKIGMQSARKLTKWIRK